MIFFLKWCQMIPCEANEKMIKLSEICIHLGKVKIFHKNKMCWKRIQCILYILPNRQRWTWVHAVNWYTVPIIWSFSILDNSNTLNRLEDRWQIRWPTTHTYQTMRSVQVKDTYKCFTLFTLFDTIFVL